MNRGRSYFTSATIAVAGLSLVVPAIAPAIAQEVGGLTASFGLRQSLEASDNFDLSGGDNGGVRSVTDLSFGLSSITRRSQLVIGGSAEFEFGDEENGLDDRDISLSYQTASKSQRLSFGGDYSEDDVDDVTSFLQTDGFFGFGGFDGIDNLTEVEIGDGTRRTTRANLTFETGLDAPLGFTFTARYRFSDYVGVTNPELFQTENLSLGASARLRLNPVTVLRVGVTGDTYEALDDTNQRRDNIRVFAEAAYDIRPDLSATTRLEFARNETTDTFPGAFFGFGSRDVVSVDEGFGGGFTITRALKNGSLGAEFDTSVTSDGRRNTVRLTRAVDLPNEDALSLSVGLVNVDGSSPEPLLGLNYRRNTPQGQLRLGLSQTASIDSDDETVVNTRLSANYDHEINSLSSVGLFARLADTNEIETAERARRLDLGVNYRRDINRDWDLVADYTYSSSAETGESDRSSNTVSLGISRSFQFRP